MNIQKELILSLSDCHETIRSYLQSNDFKVLNYKVQPFSESVNGFMGDHLLITIEYKYHNFIEEARFFAKRFPYQHEFHKRYALSLGAFPNEIFTYSVLFNKFKQFPGFSDNFAPRYYFGKDDLLLFEDLSVQGYTLPNNPNAMSLNEIQKSLEVLAKYHSGSIGYQEIKSKELNRRYCLIEDYAQCMQEPLFRKDAAFLGYHWFNARLSALNALIDQSPESWGIPTEEFKTKLLLLAEKSFEIIKPNTKFYNVLSHGDMWAKNVMVRYENNVLVDCKLIDFQLQRYSPPAHDVLQFLYLTMSADRRKRYLHTLLRYYHDCLGRELLKGNLNLNDIISYNDFEISVNYLLPQIKLQTAYYTAFQGACPEFHRYITSHPEEFKKWVFEDGAPYAVESFKTDHNYKKIVTDTIIELKDLLTHHKITVEDCFKIVETKLGTADYDLLDYHIKHVANTFSCNYYQLQINLQLSGIRKQLNLSIKSAPEGDNYCDVVEVKGNSKEAFVYQNLKPMIKKIGVKEIEECIGDYYLLRMNDIIVLDNLESLGFCLLNNNVLYTFEELTLLVQKLAIYHAGSIVLEEKLTEANDNIFRLSSFKITVNENYLTTNKHNAHSLNLKTAVDIVFYQLNLFKDIEIFEDQIQHAFSALYELYKPSKVYRNVVCHGDLCSANIMIKYEGNIPKHCRFTGYQSIRYCLPAHDLLTLIYTTTNRTTRCEFMQKLIDIYYDHFSKIIEKHGCKINDIYSYDDFQASCRMMIPQAVCHMVLHHHLTHANPNIITEYMKDKGQSGSVQLTNWQEFIKYMYEKDTLYKFKMHENLLDLKEMCLHYF